MSMVVDRRASEDASTRSMEWVESTYTIVAVLTTTPAYAMEGDRSMTRLDRSSRDQMHDDDDHRRDGETPCDVVGKIRVYAMVRSRV